MATLDLGPAMAAGIGGVIGAFLFKRSILGVVGGRTCRLLGGPADLGSLEPIASSCVSDRGDVLVYA